MKRKKPSSSDDGDEQKNDEEEEASNKNVSGELKAFVCNAGLTQTRLQTITVAYESVAAQRSWTNDLQNTAKKCSDCLGILIHLVSVYMNYKASIVPQFQPLFDRTYIRQLFNKIGNMNDSSRRVFEDPHLQTYVLQHPVGQEIRDKFQFFHKRGADTLAGKITTAAKQHIVMNFENNMKEHIMWQLDMVMFHQRHTDNYKALLKSAAHCVFQAAIADKDNIAESKINTFLTRERQVPLHTTWTTHLRSAAALYRTDIVAHFRVANEHYDETKAKSDHGIYNYFIKSHPSECLIMLHRIREEHAVAQAQYSQLVRDLDHQHPKLKRVTTVADVYRQRTVLAFFDTVFDWAVPDTGSEAMTPQQQNEYDVVQRLVTQQRSTFWNNGYQPGFSCIPRSFTLLPTFQLKPAFVQYDANGLQALYKLSQNTALASLPTVTRNTRLWWTDMMSFHTDQHQKRDTSSAHGTVSKRAVLRTGKKHIARGVRQLANQSWILDDVAYEAHKQDVNSVRPLMVNSFTTDGTQVTNLS